MLPARLHTRITSLDLQRGRAVDEAIRLDTACRQDSWEVLNVCEVHDEAVKYPVRSAIDIHGRPPPRSVDLA